MKVSLSKLAPVRLSPPFGGVGGGFSIRRGAGGEASLPTHRVQSCGERVPQQPIDNGSSTRVDINKKVCQICC